MAKVEMDLSEFKRMEQTEIDLRASLKKEDELSKEIIRLKEENIKTLKSNEKKVTIVKTKRSVINHYQKKPSAFINNYIESKIHEFINSQQWSHTGRDEFGRDEYGKMGSVHQRFTLAKALPHMMVDSDSLFHLFFEENLSEITPQDGSEEETITHLGLDQVKEDLRVQAEKNAERGMKDKIHELSSSREVISELKKNLKESVSKLSEQERLSAIESQLIEGLESQVDSMSKEIKLKEECLSDFRSKNYKSIANAHETNELLIEYTFLKRNSVIKKLKDLWKISQDQD